VLCDSSFQSIAGADGGTLDVLIKCLLFRWRHRFKANTVIARIRGAVVVCSVPNLKRDLFGKCRATVAALPRPVTAEVAGGAEDEPVFVEVKHHL
jgi:hypothetical protein